MTSTMSAPTATPSSSVHVTDPAAYFALRADPPRAFIDEIRQRFPVDDELDRNLVAKLERRASAGYTRSTIEEFVACLDALVTDTVEGDHEITEARWFAGGASKIQLGCRLTWTDPARGRVTDALVVRMDPAESLNATSRRQEVDVLRAVAGTVPVPHVFALDAQARWFPQPALVYSYVAGVTKPSTTQTGGVSGRRVWAEDRGEDFPLVDVAASWLERHLPVTDRVGVVHGDYRSGNFLFDETSGDITAWLDWEYCHLGDRHRDLAWVLDATFGHADPGTGEYLVSGLFTEEEFLARYAEASGLEVDPVRIHYYKVANTHQLLVATLATAYRISGLGKTHQDVLLSWVKGMVPTLSRQLVDLLDEEV